MERGNRTPNSTTSPASNSRIPRPGPAIRLHRDATAAPARPWPASTTCSSPRLECEKVRPRFAYLSPFLRQSKAVAWDYLRHAMRDTRALGATAHESELRVDYPYGAQVRLYGADNPDALRGIYLDGIVLDEYADMDPRVWSEIIRPALADRQGWAVFIGTPKGRNAFFELWRRAQAEEGWFA